MSRLHLLSRPLPEACAQNCLDACATGDSVLLLGQALLSDALPLPAGVNVYARQEELDAFDPALIKTACEAVTDDVFVALTETHQSVVSWY
ncbi:hypothetical protein [Simiduia agarivorans]|uniref:Sulfurtransferase complex subunit TusB n=1 Tax=Simiduia agarivorans (strain DSM 21679 / JCM 13881 / BCRC 17597 / SA1) TaxID=1117647 RepID=K4KIZ4_SIMAS|nr:hypothetical protein [Simiduia agarivorans]AFU97953.1 hypothetical protein M5M_03720 [Simiduia agarivorans SA1 = DSM 21679]